MTIENRNLEVGIRLVARYKDQEYVAEVVAGPDGKFHYRLEDGCEFASLSAAVSSGPTGATGMPSPSRRSRG